VLELLNRGWFLVREIVWHKPNARPESVRDRFSHCYENIFVLSRDPCETSETEIWSVSSDRGRVSHPAKGTLEIARRCVRLGCRPGGTVLDPFSGSGTTAIAAREHRCTLAFGDVQGEGTRVQLVADLIDERDVGASPRQLLDGFFASVEVECAVQVVDVALVWLQVIPHDMVRRVSGVAEPVVVPAGRHALLGEVLHQCPVEEQVVVRGVDRLELVEEGSDPQVGHVVDVVRPLRVKGGEDVREGLFDPGRLGSDHEDIGGVLLRVKGIESGRRIFQGFDDDLEVLGVQSVEQVSGQRPKQPFLPSPLVSAARCRRTGSVRKRC
jgi:hypothetical protein